MCCKPEAKGKDDSEARQILEAMAARCRTIGAPKAAAMMLESSALNHLRGQLFSCCKAQLQSNRRPEASLQRQYSSYRQLWQSDEHDLSA